VAEATTHKSAYFFRSLFSRFAFEFSHVWRTSKEERLKPVLLKRIGPIGLRENFASNGLPAGFPLTK